MDAKSLSVDGTAWYQRATRQKQQSGECEMTAKLAIGRVILFGRVLTQKYVETSCGIIRELLPHLNQFSKRVIWLKRVAAAAGMVALSTIFVFAPEWLLKRYDWDRLTVNERAARVDDFRRTLVQALGLPAGLLAIWYVRRGTKATENALIVTRETLVITKEGQITDRFAKAIELLGACDKNGNKLLEIRFGGIYALERIAEESQRDHWPIMEILNAYVRHHSPVTESSKSMPLRAIGKDIQAILNVIGRRKVAFDVGILNFSDCDLARSILSSVNLREAAFDGANLEYTVFVFAHLEDCRFAGTNLKGADFAGAHLEGAMFLNNVCLTDARFFGANLKGAHFTEAVGLTNSQLKDAVFDETTIWPDYLKEALGKPHIE